MLQVTFPEIARVLQGLHSPVPAAEGHGCLCGALCTTVHYSMRRWIEEIIPEEDSREDDDSQQPLRLLFADTLKALRGAEMGFELLLPDDDMALEARATALSQWCQGFLYGFGLARPPDVRELPADVDEVLRDLSHISQAGVEAGEGGEDEEEAYAEIVEYVRAGVQLVHDEMIDVREAHQADVEAGAQPADEDYGVADDDADDDDDGGEDGGDDEPRGPPVLH